MLGEYLWSELQSFLFEFLDLYLISFTLLRCIHYFLHIIYIFFFGNQMTQYEFNALPLLTFSVYVSSHVCEETW